MELEIRVADEGARPSLAYVYKVLFISYLFSGLIYADGSPAFRLRPLSLMVIWKCWLATAPGHRKHGELLIAVQLTANHVMGVARVYDKNS